MLIAIEGCFGAGKTTVASGLATYRERLLLLENFEANPFLPAFYKDPVDNALETEFAFLLVHFHQLKSQLSASRNSEIIADFHLGKDLLYADLNMSDDQQRHVFRSLYALCEKRTPGPGLVIYLSATTNLLVDRIRSRNRGLEIGVDPGYCDKVNKAYEEFFAAHSGKKLKIDMNEWDFVQDPSLFERLSHRVDRELGKA